MYQEEYLAAASAAVTKLSLLKKNPAGYLLLSILAGMFIGFGVLLSFTVGGMLDGEPAAKLAMGACFAAALSLVVMAGAELFTGNNLVMAAGMIKKKVTVKDALLLWLICWLGNAAGSILLSFLYEWSGLGVGAAGEALAKAAVSKMSAAPSELFLRGLLCNMLVCLAVWCGFRCKSEAGKLIMIFWSILVFFTVGFEHSVANMTTLTCALIYPAAYADSISVGGWLYNLLWVTLGNMAGGILFVAVPYAVAS